MTNAMEVAKFLIYLASCEQEPDFLTHLRVQKLLYYVQGWSLALRDQPMFTDRIEAWAHGPVVKAVYEELKKFSNLPINPDEVGKYEVSEEDGNFIISVWEAYKAHSSTSLRDMTHEEAPWKEARRGLPPEANSNAEITPASMKEYFSSLVA